MTAEKTIYGLIGSGGFAREVMPIFQETINNLHSDNSDYEIYFVEQKPTARTVNEISCISEEKFVSLQGNKYFNIPIGTGKTREKIAHEIEPWAEHITIKADSAEILTNNNIHPSAIFCSNSMVTSNVRIGKYFQCNIYSYVAHDCIIGDYVTFAPNVSCNGNIIIKDHAYIGTGAVIKQGTTQRPIVIGENAVVGMGAIVTKDVEPNTVVVGNPARLLK